MHYNHQYYLGASICAGVLVLGAPIIVFRFRFLYGSLFVTIIYVYMCIYLSRWRHSRFVDFSKLLFALSSLSQPFD